MLVSTPVEPYPSYHAYKAELEEEQEIPLRVSLMPSDRCRSDAWLYNT